MQRAQQLEFLKGQGLIKDEPEVKGGASSVFDTGSVTSTHVSSTAGPAESSALYPESPRRR
jgi:hypothetical protein